jgi:hypothetical protein
MRNKANCGFQLFNNSFPLFPRKLKLYEEQELTMQVFSEPEMLQANNMSLPNPEPSPIISLERRDSYEISQAGDNTYATIQPRNQSLMGGEVADYATLTNARAPSVSEHISLMAKVFDDNFFLCCIMDLHSDFLAAHPFPLSLGKKKRNCVHLAFRFDDGEAFSMVIHFMLIFNLFRE